jgi:sodium-dependent dicarboxylate transporter 2/3/5
MALILFILPSKKAGTERIMNWQTANKIPWQIVLLFGGGFALASGFKESGLSMWIGDQLNWVSHFNPILVIFFISLLMTFLTEITSNTATTQMILPILAGIAVSTKINPLLLMLPATYRHPWLLCFPWPHRPTPSSSERERSGSHKWPAQDCYSISSGPWSSH